MQAVFLPYYSRDYRKINTILRTYRLTGFTAIAFMCDLIALHFCLFVANRKRSSFNRLLGKVKPFTATFIELKNSKSLTGFFCRIDFIHIWIFFKKLL